MSNNCKNLIRPKVNSQTGKDICKDVRIIKQDINYSSISTTEQKGVYALINKYFCSK